MDTITITLTDSVTGATASGTADFTVSEITVANPGDQTGTVGTPI